MSYLANRPSYMSATAVRSYSSGIVHKAAGWSAYEGTRTACGRTLKHEPDFEHLSEFTEDAVLESFPHTRVCPICLRRA